MSSQVCGVLVALGGEDQIRAYIWDGHQGQLMLTDTVPAVSRPAPLALSRDRNFLFAGLRGTNRLESFRVVYEPGAGNLALTSAASVDLDADPCYLGLDAAGRWLMAAYYGAGQITVHEILDHGTPAATPAVHLATGPKAHCIRCHRSSNLILVPHVGTENSVHQFLLDPDAGTLSALGVCRAESDAWIGPEGPRHYVYHEPSDSVYFSNEHASSVTHWRVGDAGLIERSASLSTLPIPYGFANTCAQIHMTPDGRFLYVSNRGHNSLAIFRVDPISGTLQPAGWQETEPVPRAFALLPDGSHLLCSGLGSGCISAYAIDPESGRLRFRSRLHAGRDPMWILPLA